MPGTASRPGSGALSTQFVHAVERYKDDVVDISKRESVIMRLAEKKGFLRKMTTGMAEINPVIDKKDVPVTGFTTGFETLPVSAVQGAHAFYVEYANVAAPVAVSWVEERKLDTPQKMIDLVKTRLYKAGVAINQKLETAFFQGSVTDASMPVGLEQLVFAADASLTANTIAGFLAAQRWRFRQAANTVHGWGRAAFTADDVTGTHFENLSADVHNGGNLGAAINWAILPGVTSGTPISDGGRVFNRFYNACSQGNDSPDLIVSTYPVIEEYLNATTGLIRYVSNDNQMNPKSGNLSTAAANYRGADWYASEEAIHSGNGSTGAAANDPLIYFLNTRWMEYQVDSQGYYNVTDWGMAPGQVAAAQQCLVRCQLVINNPRMCGVLFGWGI